MLGVRFLATEYATGWHGGRVDSLGLDENGSPAVIEYKRGIDTGVLSQAVSYLNWLENARPEFEALVRARLGEVAVGSVDWRRPRVIVVAADFTRNDRDAVRRLGIPVDMIRYRVFGDGLFVLQLVESVTGTRGRARDRRPSWTDSTQESEKTAAPAYSSEVLAVPACLADLYKEVRDMLCERDIEVRPTRTYIAFRGLANVASVVFRPRSQQILLNLSLCPDDYTMGDGFTRDMRGIGHHGTGDLQVRIRSTADLERARPLIVDALNGT
ncbi:DUF5655 domain-containing protein [Streptomyces sp. NPDC002248]